MLTITILLILLVAAGIRVFSLSVKLKTAGVEAAGAEFLRNCTSNAIFEFSMNGEILSFNPAVSTFLDTDRENLIGKNLSDLNEYRTNSELFRLILDATEKSRENGCSSFVYDFTDTRGQTYSSEVFVRILPKSGRKQERILCVSKDSTSPRDAKHLAMRSRQVEELLGKLVSMAFSASDAEQDFLSMLGLVGTFLHARRGFLFQLKNNQEQLNWTALWQNDDVPEFDEEWFDLPATILNRFLDSEDDDFLVIRNSDDTRDVADKFRLLAERNQIGSIVVARLAVHGEKTFGYAGFSFATAEPFVGESEALLMKVLSETLTGLLAKSYAEKEKKLFEQCVEAAGQGIALINSNGYLYYSNEAYKRITGSMENPAGPVWKYYDGSYEDKVEKFILPLVRGGTRWNGELAIKQGEGILSTLESFFPIDQTVTGEPLVADIITNINAQKHLEKQLTEARKLADSANREKSDYLANMSHEIRNPMNAIIGLSYLGLQSATSPRQRDYITKINTAAHSLLNIINSVLDLSKIESGKLEVEQAPFTIDSILENLANLTLERTVEKKLELLFRRSAHTNGEFLGDALRIGQVLLNLVGNAVKFTENGRVVVTVEQPIPGYVRFSVKDTGIGMTNSQMEHIFEPFRQADATTSRKYGGTGLGLAISKQLVELMGGTIQIESQPESGSCFSFRLPLDRPDKPSRNDALLLPAGIRNSRAFCVATDSLKRDIHRVALLSLGFEVTSCASIKEALESPERPRVITLDIDACGRDCSAAVSALSAGEDPEPILIVSGVGGYAALETAVSPLSTIALLPLPYSYRQLGSVIVNNKNGNLPDAIPESDIHDGKTIVQGRILLAEDDEINQQVALELLSQTGLVIDIAEDGRQAIQMCKASPYNLVLMDIHMPLVNGFESASAIRRENPNLPIVAMTASALGTIRSELRNSAFSDYLTKPIDPNSLYRVVGESLGIPAAALKHQLRTFVGTAEQRFDIPGLNEDAGIGYVLGNRSQYRKILNRFVNRYSDFQYESPDELMERLHELRGASGNIGADEIRELSGALEDELRNGGAVDPIRLKHLADKLLKLTDDIRVKLQYPFESQEERERRRRFIDELETRIRHSDTGALSFLESQSSLFTKPGEPNRIEQIRGALIHMNFDRALDVVDEWRSAEQQ